jgi:hypothetical protein
MRISAETLWSIFSHIGPSCTPQGRGSLFEYNDQNEVETERERAGPARIHRFTWSEMGGECWLLHQWHQK